MKELAADRALDERRLEARPPFAPRLSRRDRRILDLARTKFHGSIGDFADALRALTEAVEESIPGGRVFYLGTTSSGPILGSIISGIGLVDSPSGPHLVRAMPGEVIVPLGRFYR